MPNHKSPEKRLRRDERVHALNRSRMSQVKTLVKKVRVALETADSSVDLPQLLKSAQSALARAASRKLIHPNTAARKTGRLMKKVRILEKSAS